MKRSKAVNIVNALIARHLRNEGIEQTKICNVLMEAGEDIIIQLEAEGMLPPTIRNPVLPQGITVWSHATERALDDLYNRPNRIPDFEVNVWEFEDELEAE